MVVDRGIRAPPHVPVQGAFRSAGRWAWRRRPQPVYVSHWVPIGTLDMRYPRVGGRFQSGKRDTRVGGRFRSSHRRTRGDRWRSIESWLDTNA